MKKTLLIAAAALVAATISSEAQVYSANVVGYVNVVLPGNGFALIANPFDDGNGNHLTNILRALPGRSSITTFGVPTPGVPNTITRNPAGTAWTIDVQLPPGTGFYVRNGLSPGAPGFVAVPTLTNTFVGSVVVLSGQSVTNDIPPGFSLQGSTIPYAGNIANPSGAGDANLNYGGALSSPNNTHKSAITTFDPVAQTASTFSKNVAGVWTGTATIGVGQGFYINNQNVDTNMVQSLP